MHNDHEIVRVRAYGDYLGVRSSAVAELIVDELASEPFATTGGRAKGCFRHEILEVVAARAAGATDDEVRSIVRRQILRREKLELEYARRAGASEAEIGRILARHAARREQRDANRRARFDDAEGVA